MEPEGVTPVAPKKPQSPLIKIAIIVGAVFAVLTTFASGFALGGIFEWERSPSPSASAQATPQSTSQTSPKPVGSGTFTQVQNYEPGNHYYDDTIIFVTKEAPHIALVATVARHQQDKGFIQTVRANYFDGTQWTRKIVTTNSASAAITANDVVKQWTTLLDPSRVLKENTSATLVFDGTTLTFQTGLQTNEHTIRSLPGYTKLLSESDGVVTVNGKRYEAHVAYMKLYSLNDKDMAFYDTILGTTTDLLTFWDEEGNFYFLDETDVSRPTPLYQTHQLGIATFADGTMAKTFSVNPKRGNQTPPQTYTFTLGAPISSTLNLTRFTTLNKAPNDGYDWYLGHVNGTVVDARGTIKTGIGIIEYIRD